MFQIPQPFSGAGKAQLDAQFDLLHQAQAKAFDHAEQLLALHASSSKAALDKAASASRQLLAAKDPRTFFALAAAQVGPALEHLSSYGKQLWSIAGGAGRPLNLVPAAPPLLTLTLAAPAPAPAPIVALLADSTAAVAEEAPASTLAPVAAASEPEPEPVALAVAPPPEPEPATAAVEPAAPAAVAAALAPAEPIAAAVAEPLPKVAKPASVKPAAAATEPKQRDTIAFKTGPKTKK